jgi:hypothetical protein
VPPQKKTAATKKAVVKTTTPPKPAADDVYENNKARIDEALRLCCGHLNGLSHAVADEVLARLPAYCEENRVTLTARANAKKAKRKSTKTPLASDPLWG